MSRLVDMSELGVDPATDVATVTGRNRLPSDVVSELINVLVHEPRVVVCDLTGMAASGDLTDVFAPVVSYLTSWPGTVVVVCQPDAAARARMLPVATADRLLVHASRESGVTEALSLLHPLRRSETRLAPVPIAARDARAYATRVLLDWQMSQLIGSTSLVISELVTNSMVHAVTVLDLRLSCVGSRVRIAVHDHGGGSPAAQSGETHEPTLGGRGLLLVEALTRGWGVLPGRHGGKTVWAVLDVASDDADALAVAH